jgi:hypothetical protein
VLQEASHSPDVENSKDELLEMVMSLTNLIKLYESGKMEGIKMQDAPLSIKLIPNTDRITIEK